MFDLFDLYFKNWDRPMREINGYKVITTDNGYLISLNVLGVEPDDLTIKIDNNYLVVKGETFIQDIDFKNTVNYKFTLNDKVLDNIKNINYTIKNGIAYVYINLIKEKIKKEIVIEKI